MQDYLLQYSFRPTEFYTHPKFVHQTLFELRRLDDAEERSDEFVKIYLNPSALSYHNMDNILPLDSIISRHHHLRFQCMPFDYLNEDVLTSKITSDTKFLLQLHNMNLYEPKFQGKSYRGGKRFIFRSDKLAELMYTELKNVLPVELQNQFHSVNPVFRYNCFQPSDNDFHEHLDIAFTDLVNDLRSRYSLLIYLTEGLNEQTLKIDDLQINKLAQNQIIIMAQQLLHSGKPYKTGNKIFVRTDLIYKVNTIKYEYNQQQAQLFNTGCYMSKEGLIDQELLRYSSQCFAKSSLLRYSLQSNQKLNRVFLHKHIKVYVNNQGHSLEYFADGSNYYFSAECDLELAFAATLLDYFRGPTQVTDKYYFEYGGDFQQHFSQFYQNLVSTKQLAFSLNNRSIMKSDIFVVDSKQIQRSINRPDRCCLCSSQKITDNMIYKIYDQFKKCLMNNQNSKYSMLISNDTLVLNIKDMQITQTEILFRNTGTFSNFNYASCQCGGIKYEQHLTMYHPNKRDNYLYNLPSVQYVRNKSFLRLKIDLFRNGFVVQSEKRTEINHENLQIRQQTSDQQQYERESDDDQIDEWANQDDS